jgi:hypothetical protein
MWRIGRAFMRSPSFSHIYVPIFADFKLQNGRSFASVDQIGGALLKISVVSSLWATRLLVYKNGL